MAEIKLRNSKFIGDSYRPYIIAEVNTSHFGDIDIAKKMILKAKKIGCDCVKFQSWTTETLYSKQYYRDNPIAKRFVKKFSFSNSNLKEISNYCLKNKIDFSSTPYSLSEVDFLVSQKNVPFIKVASMDLNNHPYLKYIASTGLPIILSTGMGETSEIEDAVKAIKEEGNKKIILLHCVSIYPTEISQIRLKNIVGLKERFPDIPIGFSDHTIGSETSTAAVALGANVIEKHFTLDKKKIGMDNHMASEPDEMEKLIQHCQNVFIALGGKTRVISNNEKSQRKIMRRSIVAAINLKSGTILSEDHLNFKRPGTGIPPNELMKVIGAKLKHNIETDDLIMEKDLIR